MSRSIRAAHRRVLAAPFVVTAALGGGCRTTAAPPPAEPAHGAATPPAGKLGPVMKNPPPPHDDLPAPPAGGALTDKTDTGYTITYPDGSRLERAANGTCTLYSGTPDCPPNAMCNPPPPREVRCPTELPPAAGSEGDGQLD